VIGRVENHEHSVVTNIPKTIALHLLRAYKWALSPLLPPSCRYVPTCSEYAAEAVDRYGVLRGGLMAAWRLLRCHPFVKGGYDPVVQHRHETSGSQSLRIEMGKR
jgi:putative membrane protein insertion efficiency factor